MPQRRVTLEEDILLLVEHSRLPRRNEGSRGQSRLRSSTRSMGFPIPGVRCPLSVHAQSRFVGPDNYTIGFR